LARLVLSKPALADLDEISAYISKDRTPKIADAVIARIVGTMEVLVQAPRIGRIRPEFPDKPRGYTVRPHIIFYEPLDGDGGIGVWRVLHGARDLKTLVMRPFWDETP
jgi:plasmid stabilization system protein ParE